jgi:hypothetical protein
VLRYYHAADIAQATQSHPPQPPQSHPAGYGATSDPSNHPGGQAPKPHANQPPPPSATQTASPPNFNPFTQHPPTDPLPVKEKADPYGLSGLGLGSLRRSLQSSSKQPKSEKRKDEEETMNKVAEDIVVETVLGVHLSEEDKAMLDGLSALEDAKKAREQPERTTGWCSGL